MSDAHGCFVYLKDSELRVAAVRFLSGGLTGGQQVGFFGWGGKEAVRGRLGTLADWDELTRRGAARVASFDQRFRRDEVPDPLELVSFWSDATNAALDAGFTGLRAVADTTPWVRRPEQRAVFLRGEQRVDRYRIDHPFTLLCAVDASTLTGEAVAETVCIHPVGQGVSTPFHLHAAEDADFTLHGEIDAYDVPLLERALDSTVSVSESRQVVIDAAGLDFIDHHGLLTLESHADRTELGTVVLRNASRTVGQMVELLELRRVRVAAPR